MRHTFPVRGEVWRFFTWETCLEDIRMEGFDSHQDTVADLVAKAADWASYLLVAAVVTPAQATGWSQVLRVERCWCRRWGGLNCHCHRLSVA